MLEFLAFMAVMILLYIAYTLSAIKWNMVSLRKGLYFRLSEVQEILQNIEILLKPAEQKAVTLELYEIIGGELKRVLSMVQSIEETKKYKVIARDKAGNEAKLDGAPQLSFSSELASLVANEDGSFDVIPAGPVGDAELQMVADALIGEGEEQIFGTVPFQFVAGKAVSLELQPL